MFQFKLDLLDDSESNDVLGDQYIKYIQRRKLTILINTKTKTDYIKEIQRRKLFSFFLFLEV